VKDFQVGASIAFGFKSLNLEAWTLGARYVHPKGYQLNVSTAALKTYTTGVFVPFVALNKKMKFAAQVDCGDKAKGLKWSAAVETPCLICGDCQTLKVKVDQDCVASVSVIRSFTDKWKAAVSISSKDYTTVGVLLTRE